MTKIARNVLTNHINGCLPVNLKEKKSIKYIWNRYMNCIKL